MKINTSQLIFLILCIFLLFFILFQKILFYNRDNIIKIKENPISIHYYNHIYNNINKTLIEINKKFDNCTIKELFKCEIMKESQPYSDLYKKAPYIIVPYSLNPSIILSSSKECINKNLILLILTSPNSYIQRELYRRVYKKYDFIEYYFFTGYSRNHTINHILIQENNKNNDIIQFDTIADYYNMTIHTITSLKWARDNCKNYKYVVDHQSDIFLNIPYYLKHFYNSSHEIIGYLKVNVKPYRIPCSWYMPVEVYPNEYYPDYVLGPCIFFSENALNLICNEIPNEKRVVYMDDLYLGFLIERANLTKSITQVNNHIQIYSDLPKPYYYVRNYIFWIHGLYPDLIQYLYSIIN